MDVTRKSARKWIDSLSLRVQQGLFAAATYLILLAICLLAISPEQYDLSGGRRCAQDDHRQQGYRR